MADSPTPRSYRIPPLTVEGGQSDPFREELRDIVTLILDVKQTLRSLRADLEEIKALEEKANKKPSLIPPSLKGAVTTKRAMIAAILALLTALPEILEQLQQALEKLPQ